MLRKQPGLLLLLMTISFGLPGVQAEPTNQNMMEVLSSLEQLENEIRQMRGDVEEMSHELKEVRQRQRELYIDIDRRLRELELSGVRPGVSGSSIRPQVESSTSQPSTINHASDNLRFTQDSLVTTSPTTTNSASITNPSVDNTSIRIVPDRKEREVYNKAFDLLKEGRYEQSIQAFQDFMGQYPRSSYSDNAQYWLGEANYVSRKYKAAVKEFGKVINYFPSSPKVSGAKLKLGFSYYELGDWKKARQTLQGVLKQYPADTSARLAETRLQRMQGEGH